MSTPRPLRQVERLTEAWLASQRSANTRAAYRTDLARFSGWCASRQGSLLRTTPADVAEYRRSCLADGSSGATVARRLSVLSSFFRFAAERHAVDSNPADAISRPDVPAASPTPVLDGTAISSLLDASERLGARAATLVALLVLDGLKLAEVLALDVEDLDRWSSMTRLRLRRGDGATVIALHRRTARALGRHLEGRTHGPVFVTLSPTRRGERLSRFGADYLLKQVSSAAGIERPVSANVLRHSFIRRAHAAGRALGDIQVQLGHLDARTTRRFLPEASLGAVVRAPAGR